MPARLLASVAETLASRARSGPSRRSWSFGFEVMARTLRKTGLSFGRRTPLEQRAAWEQIAKAKPNPLRRQLTVTPVDAGGVPAKWVVPRGVAPSGARCGPAGGVRRACCARFAGKPGRRIQAPPRIQLAACLVAHGQTLRSDKGCESESYARLDSLALS